MSINGTRSAANEIPMTATAASAAAMTADVAVLSRNCGYARMFGSVRKLGLCIAGHSWQAASGCKVLSCKLLSSDGNGRDNGSGCELPLVHADWLSELSTRLKKRHYA